MNTLGDIYTTYNIDKSKLKRDYIENPLKKYHVKMVELNMKNLLMKM